MRVVGKSNHQSIGMSHWLHTMVDGTKFYISCKWLRSLRKGSHWKLIQNSAPFTIVWCQCDIWIDKMYITYLLYYTLHPVVYLSHELISTDPASPGKMLRVNIWFKKTDSRHNNNILLRIVSVFLESNVKWLLLNFTFDVFNKSILTSCMYVEGSGGRMLRNWMWLPTCLVTEED